MEVSSSSDDEIPKEVLDIAKAATLNLLPDKSRHRYEKEYGLFMDWCSSKKVKAISEDVMLAYFVDKFKDSKSSSLWSYYSMLRSTISIKNNVDISRYAKLMAYLKRKSVGYKAKKSKAFSKNEVVKFLVTAPDEEFLLMKVLNCDFF